MIILIILTNLSIFRKNKFSKFFLKNFFIEFSRKNAEKKFKEWYLSDSKKSLKEYDYQYIPKQKDMTLSEKPGV